MEKRFLNQRLLAIFLTIVMALSPVVSGIQTEAEESQAASYYEDLNAAGDAVMAACGIGDASKYTDVQADRIIIFLNEWSLIAYAATTKEEADAVLADAVAAFKEIKIHDSAAMAEYEKLMEAREAALDECRVVLEANIANIKYTKTSRTTYELEARECLSALSIVTTYEKIDEQVAAFEACSSILVELSEDIVAAKEEAKLRIREIIKEEFEGCFAESSYDKNINDADTLEEIEQAIEDARANMLLSVNKDINSYRNRKIDRLQELLKEYEAELSAADYKALKAYISEAKLMDLFLNAVDKADVDNAYQEGVAAIAAKAEELKNTPDESEETEKVLQSVDFHKTQVTIGVGQIAYLLVIITPETAEYSITKLSPGDYSVVSVESDYSSGDEVWIKVTGKKAGTAVVTYEIEGKTASCTVTVTEELQEIKADKVTLSAASLSLIVGDQEKLTATLVPENVTNPEIVWEVEDSEIVSVSDEGNVTALKAGTTKITAKCGDVVSECEITVREVFVPGITRISGATRYETSLKIADAYKEQLGIEKFRTVVVADGRNFPDALAGSYFAAKNNAPILMVGKKGLTTAQLNFLQEHEQNPCYIIGGTGAVSAAVEKRIADDRDVERISGKTRYETSVKLAEEFFNSPKSAIFAYAMNFPDGLCGGPLAMSMDSPLILTRTGKETTATTYVKGQLLEKGIVLGGASLISDKAVKMIYGLNGDAVITIK